MLEIEFQEIENKIKHALLSATIMAKIEMWDELHKNGLLSEAAFYIKEDLLKQLDNNKTIS